MSPVVPLILGAIVAIAVPLVLWPWAVVGGLRRFGVPDAKWVGAAAGPLLAGWLLGLLVLLWPGLPIWASTAILTVFPLAAGTWSRRRPLAGATETEESPRAYWLPLLGLAVVAGLLAFQSLAFPPRDHDILIIQSYVDRLREHWDFLALPRYYPDEKGFYYPLAHPPAMMSLLAWQTTFADFGWVFRSVSTYLLLATFACIYRAAWRWGKYPAGIAAVLLLVSTPLYLPYAVNNSQDVFRNAAVAAALVLLPARMDSSRAALLAFGGLFGLAASYHSLGILFVALLGPAIALAGSFRREAWRDAILAVAAGAGVAAYPYVQNLLSFGRVTIRTGSVVDLPALSALHRETMAVHANLDSLWKAKFGLFANVGDFGFSAAAFALALAVALVGFRKIRLQPQRPWFVLALVLAGFVWIVVDPGDLIYRLSSRKLIFNRRYPMAALPLFCVAAGAFWGWWLGRLKPVLAMPVLVAAGVMLLMPVQARFAWDAKLPQERGQTCVFCSDEEKLANMRVSGLYRALDALQEVEGVNCLTFREAEYFAWSDLRGAPYYHPAGEAAIAATSTAQAQVALQAAGMNCVYFDRDAVATRILFQKHPPFAALATGPATLTLEFDDAAVWLWGEFATSPWEARAYAQPSPGKLTFSPMAEPAEYEIDLLPAGKTTLVVWAERRERRERLVVRRAFEGGTVRFTLLVPPEGLSALTVTGNRPLEAGGVRARPIQFSLRK